MTLIIGDVIAYIKKNLDRELTVASIAKQFNYSKYYFSREFKRLTGVSPREFIMALKIERSLEDLLHKKQSILRTQLSAGYLSAGTFSTTFTNNTGISPRGYQQNILTFFTQAKAYEINQVNRPSARYQQALSPTGASHSCQVLLSVPADFQVAIIFLGLFERPIPNHRPVAGVALRTERGHIFTKVPTGRYYLMSFAIEQSRNPLDYFLVNKSLRAQHSSPVIFPEDDGLSVHLKLREAQATDPPIIYNFLKLLSSILLESE